jgi:hypothetical protein
MSEINEEKKSKWARIPKKWKILGGLFLFILIVISANSGGVKKGQKASSAGEVSSSTEAPSSRSEQASYTSDPSGQQSLSVQQIFEDTTNWSGNRLFTGYVKKLHENKDALGQSKGVGSVTVGYDNKSLFIVLNNPLSPDTFKINDQISIEAEFNLISKSYGTGRGDVFTSPVNVLPWDASKKEKIPSVITADDYFQKNMKLGATPVTIVGAVSMKRVDANEAWIILGAAGGKIHGELHKSKIDSEVKQQYESLQVGDRVAFKGSFNMEMGNTAYFTIEQIILNPPY